MRANGGKYISSAMSVFFLFGENAENGEEEFINPSGAPPACIKDQFCELHTTKKQASKIVSQFQSWKWSNNPEVDMRKCKWIGKPPNVGFLVTFRFEGLHERLIRVFWLNLYLGCLFVTIFVKHVLFHFPLFCPVISLFCPYVRKAVSVVYCACCLAATTFFVTLYNKWVGQFMCEKIEQKMTYVKHNLTAEHKLEWFQSVESCSSKWPQNEWVKLTGKHFQFGSAKVCSKFKCKWFTTQL